jgi:hypothetical protein
MFHGNGVPQFWDGTQILGREVARSLGEGRPVAWDVYLFFGPETRWSGPDLPTPAAVLLQAGFSGGGGVIASRGTLPPRGDQSALPESVRARAVIAGSYADLPELLATVTARFARRQRLTDT